MKHLRKYNESKEEVILEDVKDILLELEDDGFIVKFSTTQSPEQIKILIKDAKYLFKYADVKEELLRLKDYLGYNWIFGTVSVLCEDSFVDYPIMSLSEDELLVYNSEFKDSLDDFANRSIKKIEIYFKI